MGHETITISPEDAMATFDNFGTVLEKRSIWRAQVQILKDKALECYRYEGAANAETECAEIRDQFMALAKNPPKSDWKFKSVYTVHPDK